MTSEAGLRPGATLQQDHLSASCFRLELYWIFLSQMPSNVCRFPESSSGLLCLSLLSTDDKTVDETRGLVTSGLGDTR